MKVDVKSRAEIDRMREACRMSAEIRDICAAAVAPGVTTGEIDALVVDYCEKHHVRAGFYDYHGYPGHLCVSINDEVIHGIPSPHRVIVPGDLVKTDVGIFKNGFNGDTSRTVAVGVTDPEVLRLVETTKACLKAGIAACGPGVHLGDVGYAIEQVAVAAGFGVPPRHDHRHRADDHHDQGRRGDRRPLRRLDRRHPRPLAFRPFRAYRGHHRRRLRNPYFAGGLSLKSLGPKAPWSNGG